MRRNCLLQQIPGCTGLNGSMRNGDRKGYLQGGNLIPLNELHSAHLLSLTSGSEWCWKQPFKFLLFMCSGLMNSCLHFLTLCLDSRLVSGFWICTFGLVPRLQMLYFGWLTLCRTCVLCLIGTLWRAIFRQAYCKKVLGDDIRGLWSLNKVLKFFVCVHVVWNRIGIGSPAWMGWTRRPTRSHPIWLFCYSLMHEAFTVHAIFCSVDIFFKVNFLK